MNIEWRDVKGFEGLYAVSSGGAIWSYMWVSCGKVDVYDKDGKLIGHQLRTFKTKEEAIAFMETLDRQKQAKSDQQEV